MNIRKNIDYTDLYEALHGLMARQLPQMELYYGIGKAVCRRTEKGAAVMASEYLNQHYPDVKGFSPRSLRRMRDFYRTYENHPALLSRAMKLGWTLNVVIMEADLTMDLREWYMKAAEQFGWSKSELIAAIDANVHESMILHTKEEVHPLAENDSENDKSEDIKIVNRIADRWLLKFIRVGKTIWTWSRDAAIMAPLSKGAANKLPKAIYWRGIHAVGVYGFASDSGEFAHGTANPSTTAWSPSL